IAPAPSGRSDSTRPNFARGARNLLSLRSGFMDRYRADPIRPFLGNSTATWYKRRTALVLTNHGRLRVTRGSTGRNRAVRSGGLPARMFAHLRTRAVSVSEQSERMEAAISSVISPEAGI